MNGIEKITARIETDAVADAVRITEDAKTQCSAIRTEGEARAQESYWRKVQEGVKATEDRVQRLGKAADMEARKSILSYKQGIVSEAFDKAEEKLLGMSGEPYIELLATLAARAASTGGEQIVLKASDKAAYGKDVAARANEKLAAAGKTAGLSLAAEDGDFSGGLILRDGSISVNCTIEALVAQAREDMASTVAAELFS